MNQPNFPNRGDNNDCHQRPLDRADFDTQSDRDNFSPKLLSGIFILAVIASATMMMYLFERSKPKVMPSSEPTPAISSSLSAIDPTT